MYHSRWKGRNYDAGFKYGDMISKKGKTPDIKSLISHDKLEYAKKVYNIYNKVYPEILEEIKGFSDGLKINFEYAFAFLASMYVFTSDSYCTCIGISNDNGIFLARNSDFDKNIKNLTDSVFYKLDNSYSFIGHTTAMIQMEDGMNEKGLACGLTFVYPTVKGVGFNAGFLIRYILDKCRTVDEVKIFLENIDIGSSQNIIAVDKNGQVLLAELNSEERYFKKIKKGALYRTNHFISDLMIKYQTQIKDDIHSSGRYETLDSIQYDSCDINDVKCILSGKKGFMCGYDRSSRVDTIWSCIYDLKENKIYRCEGNPGRMDFITDKRW